MIVALVAGLVIVINTFIGAAIWVAMDNDDGCLLRWYSGAPKPQWLCQLIILNLWPLFLYHFRKDGFESIAGNRGEVI